MTTSLKTEFRRIWREILALDWTIIILAFSLGTTVGSKLAFHFAWIEVQKLDHAWREVVISLVREMEKE